MIFLSLIGVGEYRVGLNPVSGPITAEASVGFGVGGLVPCHGGIGLESEGLLKGISECFSEIFANSGEILTSCV